MVKGSVPELWRASKLPGGLGPGLCTYHVPSTPPPAALSHPCTLPSFLFSQKWEVTWSIAGSPHSPHVSGDEAPGGCTVAAGSRTASQADCL